MTSLFDDIIFGPVRSRRLGLSLGVNLLVNHVNKAAEILGEGVDVEVTEEQQIIRIKG